METEEKGKKPQEKVTDIEKFLDEQLYITTTAGTKIPVPKLNWKKELVLINLIQSVLKDLGPTFNNVNGNFMGLITKILEVAPDKATKFVSTVMAQSDDWVEENLDISEVVAVILPLLKNRLDLILAKLTPYLQEVNAQVANQPLSKQ